MTQEELAHRADVHRTYISLLERDKKSPTLEVVIRLSRALDVRPSEIMTRLEESMPDDEAWWE